MNIRFLSLLFPGSFFAVIFTSFAPAQVSTYLLRDYFAGHLDIDNHIISDWDLSEVTLVIRPDLTAVLDGTITSPTEIDEYVVHFSFIDPYQSNDHSKPDLNWGEFMGTLTNRSNTVVATYHDYNGSARADWPNGYDAAFGVKRPEQGENHPAPWTNGTTPDGSIEFGFWTIARNGERNGDFNVRLESIPEPTSGLLCVLSVSALALRRRRN